MSKANLCLMVGVVLVVVLLIWVCMHKKDTTAPKRDGYMAAGAMDHLDSLDPRYDLVEAPEMAVPTEHFADLVNGGDQAQMVQQAATSGRSESLRPLERLDRIHESNMMPSTAAHLPQYNIDVSNPSVYAFSVSAPRVSMGPVKPRTWEASDKFRGDIPIMYSPDVALIGKSSFGRDSLNYSAFWSDGLRATIPKQTGRGYKNMPTLVAAEGTVLDYV